MRPRATHLVLPLYALAAVVYTWPLVLHLGYAIPSTGLVVDARAQAFLLGWDWHALGTHPGDVWNVPIFHPERNTLTYMDHLLGEAALGAPVYAATGSVAAGYGFLVLFAFAASAWAAYRLARACGASRPAAWLGGFLFAFSQYHFNYLDQLNVLHIEALPLGLWFGLRCLRRGRWRDWLGLAASLLLELTLGWYFTFYLGLALVVLAVWALVRARDELRRVAWGRAALALALFAVLALPLALPYALEHRALPEFHRTMAEVDAQSASLFAYLRVSRGALARAWMAPAPIDKGYWPGIVTIACALFALFGRPRPRLVAYFAWLAGAAFVLSLGPHLIGPGHRVLPIPLPYLLLYRFVPGFASMRASGRMAILVQLALVVLAALGFDRLRRRLAAARGPGAARLLVAATFAVGLVEPWQRPLGMAELPTRATLPPVYAWLAAQPGATPVLEVPGPAQAMNEGERDVLRQYYALVYGKPRLDGASGFVSQRYRRFRGLLAQFPAPAALDTAQALGAGLVVVHWGDWPPAERQARQAALAQGGRLAPLAAFGTDAVYRFVPPPLSAPRR